MRQLIKQLVMEILSSSNTAVDIKSTLFVPAAHKSSIYVEGDMKFQYKRDSF